MQCILSIPINCVCLVHCLHYDCFVFLMLNGFCFRFPSLTFCFVRCVYSWCLGDRQWRRQDFDPGGTASVFTKADRNYINFYVNRINWKTELTRYTTAFYANCNWKCCKRKYTGFTEHQLRTQFFGRNKMHLDLKALNVILKLAA